jgi:tetratricopeptide (TPR) repeat protein
MFLDGDGAEVDWLVGYGPPPERFQARVEKILQGESTFKSLSAARAKNPKDVAAVFGLARKWADRYDDSKTIPLYKEVVRLDPKGQAGTYTNEYTKVTVPYTEYAELQIAASSLSGANIDVAPIRAFLAKYPKTKLLKDAYSRMSSYYGYRAPKEDSAGFFEDYAAHFPEDAGVLSAWLARIVRDKGPLDKGAELAEKIRTLARNTPASTYQSIADVYLLKGDKDKAAEAYGKDFMEGRVSGLAYDLVSYANFWLGKGENKDSALAMSETALKLAPDNAYIAQQAASAYVKMNMDDKALSVFGPAYVRRNFADASALNSYAWFWQGLGKNLPSALAAAKKAVELKPGQYYIWDTLGAVYGKMKNTAEAVKAMEKAIELAPDSVKESYKKNLEKIKAEAAKK